VRPRSLSSEVTRLLKSIGEKFDTAPALKAPAEPPGKVAGL
jgi:penicillin-binding protein 1A